MSNREKKQQWEVSTTGGITVGVPEVARILGFSDTYVRRMHKEWGLYPANEFNDARDKQYLKFYVDDVISTKEKLAMRRGHRQTEQDTPPSDSEGSGKKIASVAA